MKQIGCSVFAAMFTGFLAHATILPPTGSAPVAPGVFGTPATGPFLANTGFEPFTGTNSLGQTTISGEYEAMVYSDPKNTFCAGCLDFFIIVDNNNSSTDSIERITLASFGDLSTDVGYTIGKGGNPTGAAPISVTRSSNGTTVGFNFSTLAGVAPGKDTEVLEIETDATSFVQGSLQIIDSSVASVEAFAPASVPEASSISLTLLGGALLGIGLIGRRRRMAG
jgi:hypothetical protein